MAERREVWDILRKAKQKCEAKIRVKKYSWFLWPTHSFRVQKFEKNIWAERDELGKFFAELS